VRSENNVANIASKVTKSSVFTKLGELLEEGRLTMSKWKGVEWSNPEVYSTNMEYASKSGEATYSEGLKTTPIEDFSNGWSLVHQKKNKPTPKSKALTI
jgi:hypothetical protein